MGFLGIYRAVYDYTPQAEHELAISEGDLLYVLEKGDEDDWWKVKKRANSEDDDEPVGLIPNNYIEEAFAPNSRTWASALLMLTVRLSLAGPADWQSSCRLRLYQTD